jgi:hypothetical protein
MAANFGISSKQTQLFALGIFSWYASRIIGFIVAEIYEMIWVISGFQNYGFIYYSKLLISFAVVIAALVIFKRRILSKVSIAEFSFKKSVLKFLIALVLLILLEFLYGFYSFKIYAMNPTVFESYILVKQGLNQFWFVSSLKTILLNLVSIIVVIDWKK